ncbi:MAG: myxococcus cysteine-rich repeat containing protein, partial [Myxococcota bacterium]
MATLGAGCGDDDVIIPPGVDTTGTGGSGGLPTTTTATGVGGDQSTGGAGGIDIPRMDDTGNEACPGDAYSLSPSTSLRLAGTTIDAANDYEVFGETQQTRGGDRVYSLEFTSPGSLRVVLRNTTDSNDPKLYILSEDRSPPNDTVTFGADTLSLNVACPSRVAPGEGGGGNEPAPPADVLGSDAQLLGTLNAQPAGQGESLVAAIGESIQLPVFAIDIPGTIQLVVDGQDGIGFDYELDIDFTASTCGDQIVNEGETCDDGNTVSMDGCSATCLVEPNELFDTCPGQSITNLTLDNPVVIATGSTLGRSNSQSPTCAAGDGGRDLVYAVSIATDGV